MTRETKLLTNCSCLVKPYDLYISDSANDRDSNNVGHKTEFCCTIIVQKYNVTLRIICVIEF